MPTYEYHCKKCGERFERVEHVSEHGSKKPKCPECGSKSTEPVLSEFFAKTSRKS